MLRQAAKLDDLPCATARCQLGTALVSLRWNIRQRDGQGLSCDQKYQRRSPSSAPCETHALAMSPVFLLQHLSAFTYVHVYSSSAN
jgi:hypothetical protein